jgi:hypothetical protein
LATEAAVRAVTTRVYPVALYAGRDENGIPRYIQRPFSDEERRLLREHDPEARPEFERMLAAARRAGHRVIVVETHRSAERQAYLLVSGGGLTFTATSKHSSGRAVDVIVGDGNLKHQRTHARWIAFRRWVSGYEGGRFRLIGLPEKSWDWSHIELPGPMGCGSIEALLLAAERAPDAGR